MDYLIACIREDRRQNKAVTQAWDGLENIPIPSFHTPSEL